MQKNIFAGREFTKHPGHNILHVAVLSKFLTYICFDFFLKKLPGYFCAKNNNRVILGKLLIFYNLQELLLWNLPMLHLPLPV